MVLSRFVLELGDAISGFREYRVRPRGQLADRWIADEIEVEMLVQRSVDRPNNPSTRRYHRKRALPSSYPFLVDAGSRSGNCSGMEEATGAPSSFAVWEPKRLRASGRDGETVMTEPPSPPRTSQSLDNPP